MSSMPKIFISHKLRYSHKKLHCCCYCISGVKLKVITWPRQTPTKESYFLYSSLEIDFVRLAVRPEVMDTVPAMVEFEYL